MSLSRSSLSMSFCLCPFLLCTKGSVKRKMNQLIKNLRLKAPAVNGMSRLSVRERERKREREGSIFDQIHIWKRVNRIWIEWFVCSISYFVTHPVLSFILCVLNNFLTRMFISASSFLFFFSLLSFVFLSIPIYLLPFSFVSGHVKW